MPVGENIKMYRNNLGLTQKQLAEKCSISESAIKYYESNRRNPKIETLNKIADVLQVSLDDLIERNVVLSKKIIAYLERPMLKTIDYENILKILSETLNIDYELLEKCVNSDKELSLEIQKNY